MDNGLKEMVAGSLNISEPWYISGIEFDAKSKEVHIYVGIRKGVSIPCPNCGGSTSRYGYEPEERRWRHGDCMFYPTYVYCRRPRVKCPCCGVKQVNAPFERKNSRCTLLFEGYAILLLADLPRAKASEALRVDEKTLVNIINYWVTKADNERSLEDVTKLAIDETSFKRGHNYVTIVIDSQKRAVIDVEVGKDKSTVEKFAVKLKEHGGDPDKITAVTSDMSTSFLPAIKENFPNAINIIDKFHAKKIMIDALDAVRKEEQSQAGKGKVELFRGRRLFMIPRARLTEDQADQLQRLSKAFPKTGRAYRIIEAFDAFYQCDSLDSANVAFEDLVSWMRRCRLKPFKDAALTLMSHKNNIMAYFRDRITNAVCEGINSMIQAAKRKARGYRTEWGFISMIYLIVGKLDLAVPYPF